MMNKDIEYNIVYVGLSDPIKLFISHSSQDKDIANCLIDIVQSGLRLNSRQIRCSSISAYKFPPSVDFSGQLRREIINAEVFIIIISDHSIHSTYVLIEFGIRWGVNKTLIPILAPSVNPGILPWPFSLMNAINCDDPPQLHELIYSLGRELNIEPEKPYIYQCYIDKLIKRKG